MVVFIKYCSTPMEIKYERELSVTVEEFISVMKESTLGERRPVDDFERMKAMIENSNLVITARHEGKLVGIARSVSDFAFATYLSDLAVHVQYQRQGIGKELIKKTKLEAPLAKIILLAAPAAIDYYPKIGMEQFKYCFLLDEIDDLK